MSALSKLSQTLYRAARVSNEARVIERAIETRSAEPIVAHEWRQFLFRLLGRLTR